MAREVSPTSVNPTKSCHRRPLTQTSDIPLNFSDFVEYADLLDDPNNGPPLPHPPRSTEDEINRKGELSTNKISAFVSSGDNMRERVASPTSNQHGKLTGKDQAVLESLVGVLGISVENQALIYQICNPCIWSNSVDPLPCTNPGNPHGPPAGSLYSYSGPKWVCAALRPTSNHEDGEAISSVVSFLRNMVKYERNTLCNLLLTNIKHDLGQAVVGAVPKLYDLFFLIDWGFRAQDFLKIRLALLRMITAHHYLHRPPGETSSQWEMIDDQLDQLRSFSSHQKQA
ncbi:uncharacterized protein VP01_5366g1 [Puccinia sorghi]|uniref:Uncharacterized protein n=1 Tax=Puccinia sorghi TaxID=27349 RepID=A0A0L6UJZ7_9BASI|nr:uncharacterized protein VP01_5366g1 [Puccinia sorghi]